MKEVALLSARPRVTFLRRAMRLTPLVLAVALLVVAVIAAIGLGKAAIPLEMQAQMLGRRLGLPIEAAWPASLETVLLDIRLPRIVLAGLVGSALAGAGVGYQGLFRNPLADPYLMGTAAGAGLGAVTALVLPLPAEFGGLGLVQLMAFVTALATVGAVMVLARVGHTTPITTLLLAGVAVGAVASAGMTLLLTLHGDRLPILYSWLLGGFGVASWQQVTLVAAPIIICLVALALAGRVLNALQSGADEAATLGVNVSQVTLVVVVAATLATAAAVSVAGLIGFVGLIVPHVARLLTGPDHRRLTPVAVVGGAAFLVAADTIARSLPGPAELPVGVVTAACGAPFFLYLLRRQKRAIF
jgi:iron complex transport system permease protein